MKNCIRSFWKDDDGVAAIDLVLWMMLLAPALFSTVDIGAYIFQRMQVENAAQMAAQAAWKNCEEPPTTSTACANVETAIDTALASTSLGGEVTEDSTKRAEGYFCPDTTNNGLVANATSQCDSDTKAGYYIRIAATYDFDPIIGVASLSFALPSTITYTAWSRLK